MSNKYCNELLIYFDEFLGDGQYVRASIALARYLDASVFSGAEQKRKRNLSSFQFKVCQYNYHLLSFNESLIQ